MDPEYSAQDVCRCDLCETPGPALCCDICHMHLCKACVADHLLDGPKEHKVVSFDLKGSTIKYPKCVKHSTKTCELHCKKCDVPICSLCISTKQHHTHDVVDILKHLNTKKEAIRRDLQELENSIYPRFQKALSNIPVQKADTRKNSQELKTTLKEQGQALHKEIDNIIQKLQTEMDNMDSQHLTAINKQEDAINKTITQIKQSIADIKKMLDSDDVYFISAYKSRNEEFRSLPAQFHVTLPTFTPKKINRKQIFQQIGSLSKLSGAMFYPRTRHLIDNPRILRDIQPTCFTLHQIKREQIYQQIGSLSKLATTREEHGGPIKTPGAVSCPPARPLLDEPRIITDIKTEYEGFNGLCHVSCLTDSELWTCGNDKIMRLYNLQGELLRSVQTRSGNAPQDIVVTRRGDLVYTDYRDRSINLVSDTQIQTLIRLRGWSPYNLCITSCGDLLVTMITNDGKQSKVVRYSGSTEKQSIQWDDKGQPLYSLGSLKYLTLTENRNLDICVADYNAGAVVVVSAAGKLRFRYTGPSLATKEPFKPVGITTDSQSRIMTADFKNNRIHILDQDGRFLRYIDNHGLQSPFGLSVDSRDNLFMAEFYIGIVRKIQYYM